MPSTHLPSIQARRMPSKVESLLRFFIFSIVSLRVLVQGITCRNYATPPLEVPSELLEDFTLDGRIPVQYHYVDDSFNGEGSHYRFDREELNAWIDHWESVIRARVSGNKGAKNEQRNMAKVIQAVIDLASNVDGKTVGVCK